MSGLHGTAIGVALDLDGPLRGVLLVGPPGSGKSRLAAELIAYCPHQRTGLIADDLILFDDNGWAQCHEKGPLLHLRGVGIAGVRGAPPMTVDFIISLGDGAEKDAACAEGVLQSATWLPIDPATANAAALRLALRSLASGQSLWSGFEPGPQPGQDGL
ncbi:MAG: hypothetical protein AAF788_02045 [Pseudomonadota bacterium]